MVPKITFLLSVISTLVLLIGTVQLWHTSRDIRHAPPEAAHIAYRASPSNISLKAYSLFGNYEPEMNEEKIPQTLLNVKLLGILQASNSADSQALIQVGEEDEKVYQIGNALPGGAELLKILDDTVLIKYRGHIEKLMLPHDPLDTTQHEKQLHIED